MALDKIWLALDIAEKAGVSITLRAEELRPVVEAIERLQAENTELQLKLAPLEQQFEDWAKQNREAFQRAEKAEAENAKLRTELARLDAKLLRAKGISTSQEE
jgi:predicted  nucleic acid-binding Zn-ribbon protein